ncbi:hypothetical protein V7114_21080 [Neobacillus niacini]|uniref:hypothetical protein n=1 Tax=Neobacillus niacini TaxID=86668 RepID=UPI002FFF13E9
MSKEMKNKKHFKRLTDPSDYVEKNCETCKFNFGEICAAHDSLYGYGGKITDYNAVCDEWDITLEAFSEERERYYETGISKKPK